VPGGGPSTPGTIAHSPWPARAAKCLGLRWGTHNGVRGERVTGEVDVGIFGYLDAQSGSMIVSAIAAGFAGIAVVFRMGFNRTMGKLSPKRRKAAAEAAAEASSADADAV
jgi:hypothetical protein